MKIAIIGTRGIPNNYGGFEQFAQILSKGLVEKGCEVVVYNSHNHKYQKSEWQGVKIIHKYDPEFRIGLSGQFIYDLNCIINSRKQNFDVILQFGYTTNSVWYFLLPKKPKKICNPDGIEWKRSKYPAPVKKFLKFAERLAVKSNHKLVADSIAIQKYFEEKYHKKIYFVPYSADVFSNPDKKILENAGFSPYKYNMLIARFQSDNNLEPIIKGVLESKNDTPLVLVGNHQNKFGEYLKQTYKSEKIKFVGAIYDQNLLNNLRFFSKFYFHGHSAGGTNPSLLEAMACSCYIVANNNPYNRAVLEKNGSYFDSEKDVANFLNLNKKKDDFRAEIQNNLVEIETKYSHQTIIDGYFEILTS